MEYRVGYIGAGTSSKENIDKCQPGKKVVIETNKSVRNLDSAKHADCSVFHIASDRRPPLPAEICSNHGSGANETGAGLISSYGAGSFWQAMAGENSKVKEELRDVVDNSDFVFVGASETGGTGTGLFPMLADWLSSYAVGTDVVYIHNLRLHQTFRVKQVMRARDIFIRALGPPNHHHVLVSEEESVAQILQMTPEQVQNVEGLVTNLEAISTGPSTIGHQSSLATQVVAEMHSVQEILESVGEQVITQIRHDMKTGRRRGVGEQKQSRQKLDELATIVRPPYQVRFNASLNVDPADPERFRDRLLREAEQKAQETVEEWKKYLLQVVSTEGLERVGEDLSHLQDTLHDHLQEAKSKVRETREQIVDAVMAETSEESEFGLFGGLSRQNGHDDADHAATQFREAQHERLVLEKIISSIEQIRSLRFAAEPSGELPYTLPEGELLEGIKEEFTTLVLEEPEAVRSDLQARLRDEERLSEVVQTVLMKGIEKRLRFDFSIDHAKVRTGLVIETPPELDLDGSALRQALRTPNKESHEAEDADMIRLSHIAAVTSPDHLPGLFNKLVEVDEALKEDGVYKTRYTQRHAVDIHPIPMHRLQDREGAFDEQGDPELTYAALILMMAYLASGTLEASPSGMALKNATGRSVHYGSLADLARNLDVEDDHHVRKAFWNRWYAQNRSRAVRRVNRLVQGDLYRKDQRNDRFARLETFVGTKRLETVLKTLQQQVQTARRCWR